jgi:hypothetical protein
LQHVSAEMGYHQLVHNTKNSDCKVIFLGNFWYYVLTDDGLFRPKHVVSKFLIYIYIYVNKACSKKDRTFAIKTLLFILQHFKPCPLRSSLNRAQWYVTYVSVDGSMHPQVHSCVCVCIYIYTHTHTHTYVQWGVLQLTVFISKIRMV